jgi:hypothetical protein
MGQELERQCEFASALKYYYAGKVYYAKLHGFGSMPHGPNLALIMDGFRTNSTKTYSGLYQAMFQALCEVASSEKHKDWTKKHPGILLGSWASDEHKEIHLKGCLNLGVSDDDPRLETVCCAVF